DAKSHLKPPKAAECGGKGGQRALPEINKPKPTQPDRCQLRLLQQNLPTAVIAYRRRIETFPAIQAELADYGSRLQDYLQQATA
ncbi:MAG: hypothetical protein VCE74_02035, partial [Alphaproteobacteria bacterium]